MPVPTNTTGQAAAAAAPRQEAVMGKAIPTQHPAVVLRSHYRQLRALLAIAMIAVVGLTAAVVILATNDDGDTSVGSATQASAPRSTGGTRSDGGPEETAVAAAIALQPAVAAPDESKIAAAIGRGREPGPTATRPDESAVAAAISGP
jgi:hypothetical protein